MSSYSQILHNLRKEETLLIINEARVILIDIVNPRKRPIHTTELLDALRSRARSVHVLRVARGAPRVKVALEYFGAEDVVRAGDVEAVLVVELELGLGGSGTAGEGAVRAWGDEGEGLRADSGSSDIDESGRRCNREGG